MIRHIAFVVYPVAEVPRARRFYEEILGLRLTSHFQDEWIEYDIGPSTLALTTMDAAHRPGAGGAKVALEVDDLEAELRRLASLGVTPHQPLVTTPVCRFAPLRDPDGNELLLHQRKMSADSVP